MLGLKPVAAGGEQGHNEDALCLQAASWPEVDYTTVNPCYLEEAVSPHIAAQHADLVISVQALQMQVQAACELGADRIVIEGAGGWLCPLNKQQSMASLACELGYPLILVVALRLGCLNHSLLTVEAMQARGMTLAGWVAVDVEPCMLARDENLAYLQQQIDAPLLFELPHLPTMAAAADYLIEQVPEVALTCIS